MGPLNKKQNNHLRKMAAKANAVELANHLDKLYGAFNEGRKEFWNTRFRDDCVVFDLMVSTIRGWRWTAIMPNAS